LPSKRPPHRALYLQVRDALAERITTGEWKPGSPIANEADLARGLGVSSGTVRKALELMVSQRLITRRRGRGTFVSEQTSSQLAARFNNIRGPDGERVRTTVAAAEITEGGAKRREQDRLRLRAGEAVYRINRVRRHGGRNAMVENVTLPAPLFPDLADKKRIADNIGALAQDYGIQLGKAEERVRFDVPPTAIAATLGVAPGMPVMVLDRVVFMPDGRALEWCLTYCHLAGSYYLAEMS
jgi:GntR family transcriptional regulator